MVTSLSLRRSAALSCAVLLGVSGVLIGGQASAKPPSSGSFVSAGRSLQVQRRASTRTLPASPGRHLSGGGLNLTEAHTLQRFTDRSNSPRPKVGRNRAGVRVLAAGSPSWLPAVSPTRVSSARPGAVRGWQGLNEYDNQKYNGFSVEPPDQGLCAGNGYVLELINDVVRVFGTSGGVRRTATLNAFFKEPAAQFTTDPSCVFDAGSRRFFATELTLDVNPKTGGLTGKNWLDVAVSKTSDPRAGWNIYRIDTTDDGTNGSPTHTNCPCIGDYPHLATDAHGVFVTTNEYPFTGRGVFGNEFNGAQIYALSKAKMVAGARSVGAVHFENVRTPSISGPLRVGFTVLPAQTAGKGYAGTNAGTMYFVSSFAGEEARPNDFTGHAAEIGTWWIENTASLGATPALRLNESTLPVGSYGIPPLSNQKPGPVPLRDCLTVQCVAKLSDPYAPEQEGGLDSSDTRVLAAVYAHGRVYAALDTAMQVNGNVQAGFEWFDLRANGSQSSVAHQGYVGVAGGNVIYPAIATDTRGRGYVGFTLSGDRWYPSAAYLTWSGRPGTAVHVSAAGAAPEDGFCEYLAFNCGGTTPHPSIRPRWGDYGGAAWDGRRFFLAQEYIARRCTYAQFAADHTCGKTRTFLGNFSTHIQRLS